MTSGSLLKLRLEIASVALYNESMNMRGGNMKEKLGARVWWSIILFGLVGQIAWMVENMYLNVYLYKTVTYDLNAASAMVASSAVVATVVTLFAGGLSDRAGKRKLFISIGYIFWGLSVFAFSLITKENSEKLFPSANAVGLTTVMIIVMDCIMTAIGSTANDAAFNAWITDVTSHNNRAKAEGVLQVMPLGALLVIFGVFDSFTQKGQWMLFFGVLGAITTVMGVAGIFLIKDSPDLKPKKGSFFKELGYGFCPSVIKSNRDLYLIYTAICIIGIANNIYMTYLIIYVEYFLGIKDYVLMLGAILILSAVFSVLFGFLRGKISLRILLPAALAVYTVGGTLMFFARNIWFVAVSGIIMMTGYLWEMALLSAAMRDNTPVDKVGHFQGIRMVFSVLIPMCVGPFIGAYVSSTSNGIYIDPTTGAEQPVPTNYIFLAAVIVNLFIVIPLAFMLFRKGKTERAEDNANISDEDIPVGSDDVETEEEKDGAGIKQDAEESAEENKA